jgi:diguanylate cyclase (GGDEF)-like protein
MNINLAGLDLLVVDDDVTSAHILSHSLGKYGARVEVADCGEAGLLKFQARRVPIVITDINMPGMSGLELARCLKEIDKDIQVIATSVNDTADCIIAALGLSFSDYILKPFSIDKLVLAVNRCREVFIMKQRIDNEQKRFTTVLDCLGEGIMIKDIDFGILYQNRAMTEMFGDRTGTFCYEMFDQNEPCLECPTVLSMKDGRNHSACRSFIRNGISVHTESTASQLRDSTGVVTGSVEIVREITDRIKYEQAIKDMAFIDPLTGLSNRRLFGDRMEQCVAKARRYGTSFALFSLDLDYFKEINDSLGHDAGDQVLVEIGKRIRSCFKRDVDTISRQGGDEFSIIIADCGEREQLVKIAENLLRTLSQPILLAETDVQLTASIGISTCPENGVVIKELEIAADRAMYAAKKAGRNRFHMWEQSYKAYEPSIKTWAPTETTHE